MYPFSKSAIAAICRELLLVWRFIKNDIWDTVIPCIIAFLTAFIYCKRPLSELPIVLLYSIIYTLLYILTFCVCNQINSVQEDRINKPDRPLVTGLINRQAAYYRLICYNILFMGAGVWLQILWLVLAWQITTLWLCQWGGSNHWVTKNLVCISIGTVTLLAAEWKIVGEIKENVWAYIIVISCWAGFGLPLQDMRDQQGDQVMNRKTLPLAIGDTNARIYLSVYFLVFSPALYFGILLTQVHLSSIVTNHLILTIVILETLWHWAIAARLWLYKKPAEDNTTYHWFVYLFIVTIPMICFI